MGDEPISTEPRDDSATVSQLLGSFALASEGRHHSRFHGPRLAAAMDLIGMPHGSGGGFAVDSLLVTTQAVAVVEAVRHQPFHDAKRRAHRCIKAV